MRKRRIERVALLGCVDELKVVDPGVTDNQFHGAAIITRCLTRFAAPQGPVEAPVIVGFEKHARTRDLDIADRDRPEKDREKIDLAGQTVHRHHPRIVAPVGVGEGDVGGDHAGRETNLGLKLTIDPKLATYGIRCQSRDGVPPATEVGEVEVEEGDCNEQHRHCRQKDQQLSSAGHGSPPNLPTCHRISDGC